MKALLSNLLLVVLSAAICCVLYPLGLWAFGQAVFPTKANGSLLTAPGPDGAPRVVGSSQIAQPFTGDEYFWPRPSAAGYNGAAASGSNWGANNPKLRDRVAQQLGSIVQYKKGSPSAIRTPQQDVKAWYSLKPDRAADWAGEYSVAASNWAKTDLAKDKYGLQGEYILAWAQSHPEVVEDWKKANPTRADEPKPEDLVARFFASFAKTHPGKWPAAVESRDTDGTATKRIVPAGPDAAVHANFFDMWLQDPANRDKVQDLEPVPADMVTASGAGLDPHITLRNALSVYQLDRVAAKRTPPGANAGQVRAEIESLAREHSFVPLSGLVGEPLVNVLELNRELDAKFPLTAAK
ncbi:potassium-transporting ATPase subunit C [Gemmata sp. JC673]|uniref:Potassium-transporting ATPase KdpC subunit n=1 Tax=Gemmata algarum TaxID=2975278 RepID=A0ABU5EYN2_9BACT|nr:potassium-transporting ATPase subunit C [Gemmata algarum]MDY3560422.1 potassium-transporting ATPase subunit C [Gemmata algarum]